ARLDGKQVPCEVKDHVEAASAIRHRRRRKPARGDSQRRIPPVTDQRRASDTDFADNLHPKEQRVATLTPSRERQIGPLRISATAHGFVPLAEMLIMLRNYPSGILPCRQTLAQSSCKAGS